MSSYKNEYTMGNLYSLNYFENYKTVITEKYFCFSGRATRGEFWRFFLVNLIITVILSVLEETDSILARFVSNAYSLLLFIPSLGLTVRRLHDVNKSGWWILFNIIPIIGTLYLFYLQIKKGMEGDNRFGEDPMPR